MHKVDENRPYNELRITGGFSLAEVHAWVVYCLPDIPTRAPDDAEVRPLSGPNLECSDWSYEESLKSRRLVWSPL